MERRRFLGLVRRALDELPEPYRDQLANVNVVVERRPRSHHLRDAGLDPGETLFGLYEGVPLIDRTSDWLTYDLPRELIGRVWGGRYRGQKQLWFLMRFLGADSEINIHTSQAEFSAWKWLAIEDLSRTIVPFKKALYTELVDRFRKKVASA